MRTVLFSLAIVALVPKAAFADDDKPAHHVVLTIEQQPEQRPEKPQSQPQVEPPKKPANGGYVAPESVPYEGGKVPDGVVIEKRPNGALVGTGVGILGVTYAASVITAAAACPPQSTCSGTSSAAWLYVPIVGPFITAALAPTQGGAALAAFDGTLQILGGALAVAGFLAPKKFVVWQDKSASLQIAPGAGGVSLTLTHL